MDRRLWLAGLGVAALLAVGAVYFAAGAETVATAPPELRAVSTLRGFEVTLLPPGGAVPVNAMQEWLIDVKDAQGKPVTGAAIDFDAQMPAHGHGLPTAPRVTAEPQPGRYALKGVRFSMGGLWRLRVNVTVDQKTDTVDLDLTL